MKKEGTNKISIAVLALTILVALALFSLDRITPQPKGPGSQTQENGASFFDGAVISLIVPNHPGGGYDEYARLIAPYLAKYTGAQIRVRNIPGAGGIRGVSELFRAPPDGLTIGVVNGSSLITNEIAKVNLDAYRIGQLSLLGRLVRDIRVLSVSNQNRHPAFSDILESDVEIRMAATGLAGSTFVDAVISKVVFALNANIIHGFDNSAGMRQEMMRGKIDASWTSWGSVQKSVESGHFKVVLQGGRTRTPALAEVPTVFEFAQQTSSPLFTEQVLEAWDALNDVGRVIVAPPAMPPARLAFLREGVRQAMNDPLFHADIEQAGRLLNYASGKEMEGIVKTASDIPETIRQFFVSAVRSEL
jgi:tripartite-type tricarboxylate transporter receptor subunit TctC